MSKNKKKNSLLKDFVIIMHALKAYTKVDKILIPVLIFQNILAAVQPYIIIFLIGILLDSLYEGKDINLIIYYAILGVSIKLVLSLICCYLGKIVHTKFRNIYNYQSVLLSDKLMSMDYEYIESEEIQNIVRKQSEYSKTFGGVYYTLFTKLDVIIRTFVSLLISTCVVTPLFLKTGQAVTVAEKAINSPLFSIGIIAKI